MHLILVLLILYWFSSFIILLMMIVAIVIFWIFVQILFSLFSSDHGAFSFLSQRFHLSHSYSITNKTPIQPTQSTQPTHQPTTCTHTVNTTQSLLQQQQCEQVRIYILICCCFLYDENLFILLWLQIFLSFCSISRCH